MTINQFIPLNYLASERNYMPAGLDPMTATLHSRSSARTLLRFKRFSNFSSGARLGLNGLSTAAIWASLALVLANWRLVQLERLLPKPLPAGLSWVRSLSMLSLVTLLAWGLAYSSLDAAYGRLIHQFTCMTVAASIPMAFEAIFSLL
jgi:hypothetical protein